MPDQTPVSEPGPDFTSFGGGAGAAGGVVGSNHLQTAVDKLTRAVDQFDKSVSTLQGISKKMPGGSEASGMGNAWNNNGITTFGKMSQSAGGTGQIGGNYQFPTAGPTSQYPQGGGQNNMGGTLGAPCGSYGSFPKMGQTSPYPQGSGSGFPGLGNNANPPPGGDVWAGATSGQGGGGGGRTFSQMGATVAAAAGTGLAMATAYGKANLPGQIALNTYQQQAQLAAPLGSNLNTNQAVFSKSTYGTAGTARGGQQQVQWGQSPQDIAGAYSTITGVTGATPNAINAQAGSGTLAGQMISGTAQMSYLNPAMSGSQAASNMQQFYSPQASLQQRMLGYSKTPLTPGKPGANSMAAWTASQFTRWGWNAQNKPSANAVAAELGPNGVAYQNMLAEGMSPTQIQAMKPQMEAYNRLFQGNGKNAPMMSTGQAQTTMNDLASHNVNTYNQGVSTLKRYGVNTTELQQMKSLAGSQAAKQGDTSAGFSSGLTAATRSLQDFNTALQKAINTLHMQGAEGFAQGAGSQVRGVGGGMLGGLLGGSLVKSLLGGAMGKGGGGIISKLLGNVLGRGGVAGAEGAAGDAAGGGLLAGAGGTALLGGGAAAGGVGLGLLLNKLGLKIPGMQPVHNPSSWFGNVEKNFGHAGHDIANWGKDIGGFFSGIFGGGNKQGGGSSSLGGMSPQMPSAPTSQNTLYGKTQNKPGNSAPPHPVVKAVSAAMSQQGVPYVYGEEQPGRGFDCSGLVQWAYKGAGVSLPRTAAQQLTYLKKFGVRPGQAQEGDVVFKNGTGANMHEAMLVKNNEIIEAAGAGQKIKTRRYDPGEWTYASRPYSQHQSTGQPLGQGKPLAGNKTGGGTTPSTTPSQGGQISGDQVVAYAKSFLGQPYEFGGGEGGLVPGRPGPDTDCSGLTYVVYNHLGLGSGMQANAAQQQGWVKKTPNPVVGGLAFFLGSDSPGPGQAGHVGIVTGPNQMIDDPFTGTVVRYDSLSNAIAYGVPPSGNFAGGSGATTAPSQGSSPSPIQLKTASQGGMGENTNEGSTSESSAFMGAVSGGIGGGNKYTPGSQGQTANAPATSGNATVSGTGGAAVYNYLLSALFQGNKVAAAGATASIWGESTWNPEAQGTGGRGLIGWTPPSKLPNSAFTGDATKDMAAQLPLVVDFVNSNGDQGAIASMMKQTSLAAAAQIWGKQVERYGINDVHSQGLALAAQIAGIPNNYAGGMIQGGGYSVVGERGPEIVKVGKTSQVLDAAQSQALMKATGAQQAPYSSGFASGLNASNINPAFSGGPGKGHGCGGVTLNFGANSINITAGNGGGTSGSAVSTGASARNMATQFVQELAKMNLYDAIRSGSNS